MIRPSQMVHLENLWTLLNYINGVGSIKLISRMELPWLIMIFCNRKAGRSDKKELIKSCSYTSLDGLMTALASFFEVVFSACFGALMIRLLALINGTSIYL